VYLSADETLDAGDVAQQTTFVRGTELQFVVSRGALAQGDMFLFVTNDPGPTAFAPELTSGPYPVAVGRQWNPEDAEGVAGWWDASDPATLFEAEGDQAESGDVIFRFADKSGNGNHFNGVGGARPSLGTATIGTLGRQALAFGGGQRLGAADAPSLRLDGTGGVNIFSALRSLGYMDHNSGLNVILGKGLSSSPNTAYALSMRSGQPLLFQSGANSLANAGDVLNRDVIVAGVSQSAGPSTFVQVDGRLVNQLAAKGPSDNTGLLVLADDTAANNRYAAVVVGELLLVGGVLSAEDVARFEGYLAHRWGIPLDPAHPYAEKFTAVVIDAP